MPINSMRHTGFKYDELRKNFVSKSELVCINSGEIDNVIKNLQKNMEDLISMYPLHNPTIVLTEENSNKSFNLFQEPVNDISFPKGIVHSIGNGFLAYLDTISSGEQTINVVDLTKYNLTNSLDQSTSSILFKKLPNDLDYNDDKSFHSIFLHEDYLIFQRFDRIFIMNMRTVKTEEIDGKLQILLNRSDLHINPNSEFGFDSYIQVRNVSNLLTNVSGNLDKLLLSFDNDLIKMVDLRDIIYNDFKDKEENRTNIDFSSLKTIRIEDDVEQGSLQTWILNNDYTLYKVNKSTLVCFNTSLITNIPYQTNIPFFSPLKSFIKGDEVQYGDNVYTYISDIASPAGTLTLNSLNDVTLFEKKEQVYEHVLKNKKIISLPNADDFVVDEIMNRIYWIDTKTNKLMKLQIKDSILFELEEKPDNDFKKLTDSFIIVPSDHYIWKRGRIRRDESELTKRDYIKIGDIIEYNEDYYVYDPEMFEIGEEFFFDTDTVHFMKNVEGFLFILLNYDLVLYLNHKLILVNNRDKIDVDRMISYLQTRNIKYKDVYIPFEYTKEVK